MDLDYCAIFKELNESGIDYLVVGGLAVNFHGVPRMTYDVDIMILMDSANILKCVEKLTSWGYKPKIPVDPKDLASEEKRKTWVFGKGMKAFNFYNEKLPIAEIDHRAGGSVLSFQGRSPCSVGGETVFSSRYHPWRTSLLPRPG